MKIDCLNLLLKNVGIVSMLALIPCSQARAEWVFDGGIIKILEPKNPYTGAVSPDVDCKTNASFNIPDIGNKGDLTVGLHSHSKPVKGASKPSIFGGVKNWLALEQHFVYSNSTGGTATQCRITLTPLVEVNAGRTGDSCWYYAAGELKNTNVSDALYTVWSSFPKAESDTDVYEHKTITVPLIYGEMYKANFTFNITAVATGARSAIDSTWTTLVNNNLVISPPLQP